MNLPLEFPQSLLAFLVTIVGATMQSSIGFGLGPVGVPLLALIDPSFVPGPIIINGFVLNILILVRNRQEFRIKEFNWAIVGRVVGTLLGAQILLLIPVSYLALFFGGMVLFAVALSFSGLKLPINPKNLLLAGTLSGIMGTTSAIGGPPMALVYQRSSGAKVRSMLGGIFLIGTILAMIALYSIGRLGMTELKLAALMLPGTLLGFYLSRYSVPLIDGGFVRPAILSLSAVSALILLLKQVF